jgi:alpha-tubulin suppressor-like RCC1 family protein
LIDKDSTTELYTWGCNDDGVLGRPINQEDKDTEESTPTKVQIESLSQLCGTNVFIGQERHFYHS